MPGAFDRATALRRLADTHFDVLVIGGGIVGTGTALDAASRGLRTALVERDDFASGTSSKSSKLVHGGLRYLQQGDVRLVYEALAERQRLRKNAPHLVKVLPFLLPVFGKGGVIPKKLSRALGSAMWMYDVTGGARIGRLHKRISRRRGPWPTCPRCPADKLASSYLYYDAQADDARLTLTLARTAAIDFGAVVVNGARVVEILKDADGKAIGARVEAADEHGGVTVIDVHADAVVNAAGVWSDDVRSPRRGHAPRLDPSGQGHPHHRAVGEGAQRHRRGRAGAQGQALDLRRAVGRLHLHRHHRHRLRRPDRRPAVHARRHRLPARRHERRHDRRAHRGRHPRHLGRSAPARARRRQRAHGRPVPPPPGHARRPRASSRSPAASSRPTARWRPTPSTSCSSRCSGPRSSSGSPSTAAPDACRCAAPRATPRCWPAAGSTPGSAPRRSTTWPTATAARPAPCWP